MVEEPAKAVINRGETGKFVTVNSKYGTLELNPEKSVLFPYGLLGMPTNTDYVVTDFPNAGMDQFKLLQNLNDHDLSFAVLPVSSSSGMFDMEDLVEACKVIEIKFENLLILAIISVQRTVEEVRVTANMRAPLLVDISRRLGVQYVFPTNKYEIRHLLSQSKNK